MTAADTLRRAATALDGATLTVTTALGIDAELDATHLADWLREQANEVGDLAPRLTWEAVDDAALTLARSIVAAVLPTCPDCGRALRRPGGECPDVRAVRRDLGWLA